MNRPYVGIRYAARTVHTIELQADAVSNQNQMACDGSDVHRWANDNSRLAAGEVPCASGVRARSDTSDRKRDAGTGKRMARKIGDRAGEGIRTSHRGKE